MNWRRAWSGRWTAKRAVGGRVLAATEGRGWNWFSLGLGVATAAAAFLFLARPDVERGDGPAVDHRGVYGNAAG